jgi:diaminohydroxyphosphoribosylaminopyrimidine deaminase/5-amino-6-(5-phosphoribosylamino)uracil reductase
MRGKVDAIMVGAETVRKDDPSLLARVRPNKDLVRVVVSKSGRLPKSAQIFTDEKNATYVFNDAEKAVVELGKMGFISILCEGGLTLARSLAEADLVDEWLTVLAPVVIGNRPIANAVRASVVSEKCFPVEGDMFFRTRFDRV